MSLIKVTNLTFAYDGSYDNVFENVSFQIDTDWKLGFIGRNGKGKTTFLSLLLGKFNYEGNISANVEFEYFPFDVKNKQENTMDVINSIHPDYIHWKLVRELKLLEVSEDTLYRPFDTLSKGEQTKILLATLFLKENSFLLIDEPTNHLDINAREIVSNYLSIKSGFILVSHDRSILDKCIDHILVINRTKIEVQKGNFFSWWENKKLQDSFEISENEKLKKDIKRLSEAAERTSNWSDKLEKTKIGSGVTDRGYIGHKSAKMMKRSKSIESRQLDAVEKKSNLLKNIESTEKLKIFQTDFYSNTLLSLEKVSIYYENRKICNEVSFTVEKGDRIVIYGKNGAGKSSLLNLICKGSISYTGNIKKSNQLKISYVSQDTSNLSGNLTDYAYDNEIDESLFKSILRKLDFERIQFEKDMSNFSEGQKKKVLIARSLCEKAHLHIWDEPLNFIDVFSRMQIEELLLQFEPTIVFVEHDITFCNNIATKVVNI